MMATTRNFGNMGRSARSKAISRGPYVRGANPPRGACTSPTRAYVTLMRRRTCWQLADTKNSGLLEFAIEEIGIFINEYAYELASDDKRGEDLHVQPPLSGLPPMPHGAHAN